MTKRGLEDDADAQGRDPMVRCKIEQRINGTHFRVPGQKKVLARYITEQGFTPNRSFTTAL